MRITDYLAADHRRLAQLLATAGDGATLDEPAFSEFRRGLLQHIAVEEKLLFPAAQAARDGVPLPRTRGLRTTHGVIASKLVHAPTLALCAELGEILAAHDAVEEGPDGVYEECELALGDERSQALALQAQAFPPVRVSSYR